VRMRFEHRILLLSLMTGTVGTGVSLFYIGTSQLSVETKVTLAILIVGIWLGFAFHVRTVVAFPLRTLSNLMGALREGDYALRARGASPNDAMGEAVWELNALAESLREQRLGAAEATALLRRIMAQIDIAMFGFDAEGRLRLVNDSGRQLLGKDQDQVMGQTAGELGLDGCLDGPTPRVVDLAMAGRTGRWEVRRGDYREKGVSHQLVFLSDLTRTLHEEERLAWKRLIQVLRHEINNSLTPIQSVAQSLNTLMKRNPRPSDWEGDMRDGLEVIAERSEQLDRFVGAYSRLAHLPEPSFDDVDIGACVRHAVGLEQRLTVSVQAGPDVTIRGDRGQIEQLLINITSNAVEARMEGADSSVASVSVGWQIVGAQLELWVDDDGPGVDPTSDPFIPFFTTKPHGSGIGLALSRQIAEAHGGSLTLENHPNAPGCRACLRLPVKPI
jgi:two-component system, NtrC family, nitrogen regulation sensor histidine kinase NtrY